MTKQKISHPYSWKMELGDFEAEHFTKREGAGFTGWVVKSKTRYFDYSDPIPTKREAMKALRNAALGR